MSTPLHAVPGQPAAKRAGKTGEVYQLRIDLRGSKNPKVWRRIVVPVDIKLSLLHVVLLRAMGWGGGHIPDLGRDRNPAEQDNEGDVRAPHQ